jgi:hypothetical protein
MEQTQSKARSKLEARVNPHSKEFNAHEYEGSQEKLCRGKSASSMADVNSASGRGTSATLTTKKNVSSLVAALC